jgi:hypothetical protein
VTDEWPLPVDRLRVLASYHYYRTVDMAELVDALRVGGRPPDIFADSGAFSAWTQGTPIDLEEYAAWVHRWEKYLSVYCNLDVIDDPKGSKANLRALESMGLSPLPVWHIRSDWSALHNILDEYSYMAVGGMVGTPWRKLMPRLVKAMKFAGAAGVAVHGLGLTSLVPTTRLPFFSVDSSSWGSGFRYGNVLVWSQRKQEMVVLRLGDGAAWQEHRADVEWLGSDPLKFARREVHKSDIAALSGLSMAFRERAIRQRLGLVQHNASGRPFTQFQSEDGVKLFIVDGSSTNLADAAVGLRMYLVDGSPPGADVRGVVKKMNHRLGELT